MLEDNSTNVFGNHACHMCFIDLFSLYFKTSKYTLVIISFYRDKQRFVLKCVSLIVQLRLLRKRGGAAVHCSASKCQ